MTRYTCANTCMLMLVCNERCRAQQRPQPSRLSKRESSATSTTKVTTSRSQPHKISAVSVHVHRYDMIVAGSIQAMHAVSFLLFFVDFLLFFLYTFGFVPYITQASCRRTGTRLKILRPEKHTTLTGPIAYTSPNPCIADFNQNPPHA